MNHTSEEKIPITEIEMFTRVAIFDTYCRTTLYKDHYKRYHTKLTEIYKKYSMSRDGTTADSYTPVDFINDADNIIERLHEDSLFRHQLHLKLEGIVNIVESSSYSIYNKNIIRMSVSLLLLNLPPLKFPYGVKFSLNLLKLPQNVTHLYIVSPPP